MPVGTVVAESNSFLGSRDANTRLRRNRQEFTGRDRKVRRWHRPSGEGIFTSGRKASALQGLIPAETIKAAMRYMLGYEQVTGPAL